MSNSASLQYKTGATPESKTITAIANAGSGALWLGTADGVKLLKMAGFSRRIRPGRRRTCFLPTAAEEPCRPAKKERTGVLFAFPTTRLLSLTTAERFPWDKPMER